VTAHETSKRVTVAEIARAAGVSVPTVSRVLNGRADVAPETRERVEDLLRQHGYRRRGTSRGGSARLVDLVFNDLDSPWAVEIIRGAESVAHAAGIGVVISAVHRHEPAARQWLDNVRARSSDGVVLVTSELDPSIQAELDRLRVPTVIVDASGGSPLNAPTIGATNWAGGLSATQHLLDLGHTRIGVIAGPPHLMCSRARIDGHRAAMESRGLALDPALTYVGDFYHESGFEGGKALLSGPRRPTAIFASSDQMALGVYEAVRQSDLRIPDDVSIVGFDDLPGTPWSSPPLTTVRQPLVEMGMLAVRMILRLLSGEELESPRVELATELVIRASTAPPPA